MIEQSIYFEIVKQNLEKIHFWLEDSENREKSINNELHIINNKNDTRLKGND